MGSILAGKSLRKVFGNKEVVHDVTLSMEQGEIVGLLGPNGAGKTTSFYMLTGILKPSGGQVLLDGRDIGSWPLYRRARVGLSYLPQESSISVVLPYARTFRSFWNTRAFPARRRRNARIVCWKNSA